MSNKAYNVVFTIFIFLSGIFPDSTHAGPISSLVNLCTNLFVSGEKGLGKQLDLPIKKLDQEILEENKLSMIGYARSHMNEDWENDGFRLTNKNLRVWLGFEDEVTLSERSQRERMDSTNFHVTAMASVMTTPIPAIEKIAREANFPQGTHIVDVGAGFGQVALWLGWSRPDLKITGIEINEQRVEVARKLSSNLNLKNVEFEQADLWKTSLPDADVYYFYDPVPDDLRARLILNLKEIANQRSKPIKIIAVNGWSKNIHTDLGNESWLNEIKAYKGWNSSVEVKIYSSESH
ncbi:MAG: class I SAM-dependent methyltransferase [Bacteriovoracaceae bacterium]